MPIETLYELFQKYPQVETDTRQLKPGCIFFALRGDMPMLMKEQYWLKIH